MGRRRSRWIDPAGGYLSCAWYLVPPLPDGAQPGLLTIRTALGHDSPQGDLVVVKPGAVPRSFRP